jgi:membrane protein
MQIAPLWHVTLRAIQDWWNDNCLRLAASLAYYTALSLAPLVLLIVGVIGLVLDRQQVGSQLSAQLEGLIGPAGRELVTSILAATSPQGGTIATIIGLVTLLIGATAVFGELQATLNLIWEVRPAPTNGVWAGIWAVLRERLFSLALVLTLAFLLLVSLVISAALAGAAAWFQGPEQALVSRLLELAVSLLVLTFVFGLIPTLTLVANSYAAFRAAKGEQRVFARGVPANHSPSRTTFRAAAVARCCRWVLASPR